MRINVGEVLEVKGELDLSNGSILLKDEAVERAALEQEDIEVPLPLEDLRVHDALSSRIPVAAAADDLGLIQGTFATGAPKVQSSDSKAASTTQYARVRFALPAEYVTGTNIYVLVTAGTSTVADTSSTIDAQVYKDDEVGGISADLCATAAQSINAAVAEKTFTVTGTALTPGGVLDLRLTVAIVDAATGTAVVASITRAAVKMTVQG